MDANLINTLMWTTIVVVLLFDYTNGFHDASNIIGTMIASRAMTPIQSVIIVGTFEMLGPLLAGTAVANTIGKFISLSSLPANVGILVVLWGIFGAIFWNLLTWWWGLPSSSSHALVGGLGGAVIVAAGSDAVVWGYQELMTKGKWTGVMKVLASLVLSPILGFFVGFMLNRFVGFILSPASPKANTWLKRFQFISAATLAFSHGSNDAQKSMGIITLVMILGGAITGADAKNFVVPFWVILACAGFITLGILSGGWRIVRTIGFGIFKVRPKHAFSAQLTAGTLIFGAAVIGAPVSTTHVASSSIMGVGASERPKAVRWAKAKEIVSTWLITIPGSGAVSALTYFVFSKIMGW
ncbi:MAG: inorganic phosphate transporter [Magnetococcales bacterium]|nr:inorganic phosphate transporter [Magnetococcales bacterium]NGZ27952.1 inorganic phosphate transporter [Magnetococcales bacterium]